MSGHRQTYTKTVPILSPLLLWMVLYEAFPQNIFPGLYITHQSWSYCIFCHILLSVALKTEVVHFKKFTIRPFKINCAFWVRILCKRKEQAGQKNHTQWEKKAELSVFFFLLDLIIFQLIGGLVNQRIYWVCPYKQYLNVDSTFMTNELKILLLLLSYKVSCSQLQCILRRGKEKNNRIMPIKGALPNKGGATSDNSDNESAWHCREPTCLCLEPLSDIDPRDLWPWPMWQTDRQNESDA